MQQNERPKELIVPIELMDGIMLYLIEKPFKEVAQLIGGIEKTVRGNVVPTPDGDGLPSNTIPG